VSATLTTPAPAAGADGVEIVRIPETPKLDPITVFLEDYGAGKGRATIACYGSAWVCSWGAMGDRTIRQFIAGIDAGYMSGNMLSLRSATASERAYASHIAQAVIDAMQPAALSDGAGQSAGGGES
jgi:hypothetical protein